MVLNTICVEPCNSITPLPRYLVTPLPRYLVTPLPRYLITWQQNKRILTHAKICQTYTTARFIVFIP